ncbi:hypothetical protein GJAV_G00240290 [Gymnothorax javanicus]|nr:hypothetical protein GJAV_G00240290 [Gymnothorax javanicus]
MFDEVSRDRFMLRWVHPLAPQPVHSPVSVGENSKSVGGTPQDYSIMLRADQNTANCWRSHSVYWRDMTPPPTKILTRRRPARSHFTDSGRARQCSRDFQWISRLQFLT